MIKAIETRYKGYRFRSRLEARWAVFFDALNISWEYEPEGYKLPSGYYLPDFQAEWPCLFKGEQGEHYWCEIKPVPLTERERSLCEQLVVATGRACLLLVGAPAPCIYTAICPETDDQGEIDDQGGSISFDVLLWSKHQRLWWQPSYEDEQMYTHEDRAYMDAVFAARAARFEHGETPR